MLLVAIGTPLLACSIPVFRYALENWKPDPYVAWVLHSGELNPEQQQLIDTLRSTQFSGTSSANVVVHTIDMAASSDEEDPARTLIREQHADVKLPHLVVQAPAKGNEPQTVFTGALNGDAVTNLMSSPARTEIKDRLLKGDSVVWVYLECGLAELDDQKFTMLTETLAQLEGDIDLPDIEEEDLSDLSVQPEELKVQFSALRLSRNNADEAAFLSMLLHVEADLLEEDYAGEPMAFPVFGRGRALYALVGEGLAPDLVDEACRFLAGACQCTVKAQNPGVDLLMQVEWDKFIKPTEAVESDLPPLAGFSGFGQTPQPGDQNEADTGMVAEASTPPVVTTADEVTADSEPDTTSPEDETAVTSESTVAATDVNTAAAAIQDADAPLWKNSLYALLVVAGLVVLTSFLLIRQPGS